MLAAQTSSLEDAAQADAATAAWIERDSSASYNWLTVARLYLRLDQVEWRAWPWFARISEQMLAEREEQQLLDLLNEFLTCDAACPGAATPGSRSLVAT